MYFGDPAVPSLTFYVQKLPDVTIPVYYRDTKTGALIHTLALTAQYDTEFSTRSEEIGQNVPAGYTIDTTRLPEQLPLYFGDPAVTSLTFYLVATTPGGNCDQGNGAGGNGTAGNGTNGNGIDGQPSGNPDTVSHPSADQQPPTTSTQQVLPQTGATTTPAAAGAGALLTLVSLIGLAGTRRKHS
nr:LPXTG cell wall anchor domain-containing protein [Lacticaseibacillus absianus]